jgi:hypothetical protein
VCLDQTVFFPGELYDETYWHGRQSYNVQKCTAGDNASMFFKADTKQGATLRPARFFFLPFPKPY